MSMDNRLTELVQVWWLVQKSSVSAFCQIIYLSMYVIIHKYVDLLSVGRLKFSESMIVVNQTTAKKSDTNNYTVLSGCFDYRLSERERHERDRDNEHLLQWLQPTAASDFPS